MERPGAPIAHRLRARFVPNLGSTIETERPAERHNVVRVHPVSMICPEDIFTPERKHIDDLSFTKTYWEGKGRGAVNKYQVVPPGGKSLEGETPINTARRRLFAETSIAGLKIDESPVAPERTYSFRHGRGVKQGDRRENNEVFLTGTAPPFLSPRAYDPSDKIDRILELDVHELQSLLEKEEITMGGRKFTLVENLRRTPPSEVTADPEIVEIIKANLLLESYRYEISIRQAVIQRAVVNSGGQPNAELMHEEDITNVEQAHARIAQLNRVSDEGGINLAQLRIATEEVYFEESLSFIEDSGPEKSYLIGQIILDLSTITPHELSLILEDETSEVAAIFHTLIDTFGEGIDFTEPDGYEKMLERVRLGRNNYANYDPQHSAIEVKARAAFSARTGRSSEEIARGADLASEFIESLQAPLAQRLTPNTGQHLFFDTNLVGTSQVHELLYVAFGYSPYGRSLTPQEKFLRAQAFDKLISMSKTIPVERMWRAELDATTFRFRAPWNRVIGGSYRTGEFIDRKKQFPMNKSRLDLGAENEDVDVYYNFRKKRFSSYFRKFLERSQEGERIQDTFGIEVVLNQGANLAQNIRGKLSEKFQETRDADKAGITQALLQRLIGELQLAAGGSPLHLTSVKDGGLLKDILEKTFPDATNPLGEVFVAPKKLDLGSTASNPTWSWLKFVVVMEPAQGKKAFCEFQIYPSIQDYKAKKRDDRNVYDARRLFALPRGGRYPIFDLFYRVDSNTFHQVKTEEAGGIK